MNTARYLCYKKENSANYDPEKDLKISRRHQVIGWGEKSRRWKNARDYDLFALRVNDVVHFGMLVKNDKNPNDYQNLWLEEGGERWGKIHKCYFFEKTIPYLELRDRYHTLNGNTFTGVSYNNTVLKTIIEDIQPWVS